MVRSRLPKCVIALHPLKANQNILHGIVKRMSHVKLSCNVWRRNYDCKGFLRSVHLCVEIFLIQPVLIDSFLYALRVIGFCKFFAHTSFPFLNKYAPYWNSSKGRIFAVPPFLFHSFPTSHQELSCNGDESGALTAHGMRVHRSGSRATFHVFFFKQPLSQRAAFSEKECRVLLSVITFVNNQNYLIFSLVDEGGFVNGFLGMSVKSRRTLQPILLYGL